MIAGGFDGAIFDQDLARCQLDLPAALNIAVRIAAVDDQRVGVHPPQQVASKQGVVEHLAGYLTRKSRTGTVTLCCTRWAVAPRTRSAKKRRPCELMATRSQCFWLTQSTISVAGFPKASSASVGK